MNRLATSLAGTAARSVMASTGVSAASSAAGPAPPSGRPGSPSQWRANFPEYSSFSSRRTSMPAPPPSQPSSRYSGQYGYQYHDYYQQQAPPSPRPYDPPATSSYQQSYQSYSTSSQAQASSSQNHFRVDDAADVNGPMTDISQDNDTVQAYFSSFKQSPNYKYETSRHQTIAILSCPSPDGGNPVIVEAAGKNQKFARHNLIRWLSRKIEREGWLDGRKRRPGAAGGPVRSQPSTRASWHPSSISGYGDTGGGSTSWGRGAPDMHEHRLSPYRASSMPPPKLPAQIAQMEAGARKFVAYYCSRNSLAVPNPYVTQAPKRARASSTFWNAHIHLPPHTNHEGKKVSHLEGHSQCPKKKDAAPRAVTDLAARIAAITQKDFVDQFVEWSKPFKKRLQDMLTQPVRATITDSQVDRLETLLNQLRDAEAFRLSSTDERASAGASDGFPSLFSAPIHPMPPPRRRSVDPRDMRVPPTLENSNLPIYTKYVQLMSAVEASPVTIIAAETGAGKTTQIPQFILAHWKEYQERQGFPAPSVLVTQPRRIAAISVAQRVASERHEEIGRFSAVGYQVRFDDKRPRGKTQDGTVVFCTSGILLRRLQEDPMLSGVTHIILDEVHERDLNTDLLLIILRQLLQHRTDIKLVLMSATADTHLFQRYFRGFGPPEDPDYPPVVDVPGKLYPVREHYLEDVLQILRSSPWWSRVDSSTDVRKWLRTELSSTASSSYPDRSRFQEPELPLELMEAMIAHICHTQPPGAILCFLPGWAEISALQQKLNEDRFNVGFGRSSRYRIHALHSSVPMSEQQDVFERPPEGVRKIILATNIAETSITINDIVYVMDSGKIRINEYDAHRRISSLNAVWASQSNLRQRIGRAGRVQPGQYFSIISRQRRENLPHALSPELLRVDLQSTVLQIKAMRMKESVYHILDAAPQPPSNGNIRRALEELQSLGAVDGQEQLTPLGRVLADLPLDPWIGKMVLQSVIFGCLDPILTVAASMGMGRGIFAIHPEERAAAREHIARFFTLGCGSDQLTVLNAFLAYKKFTRSGSNGPSGFLTSSSGQTQNFLRSNYLHRVSLQNLDRSRQQLLSVLQNGGFLDRGNSDGRDGRNRRASNYGGLPGDPRLGGEKFNTHSEDQGLLRALLCAALFPNVAEASDKDVFRAKTENRLFITGGSANSSKALRPTDPNAVPPGLEEKKKSTSADDDDDDLVELDSPIADDQKKGFGDDGGDDGTGAGGAGMDQPAPLPPRLLCFQEKQRVENMLFMRNTTRADPMPLILFTSGGPGGAKMIAVGSDSGPSSGISFGSGMGSASSFYSSMVGGASGAATETAVLLDGWIRVHVGDSRRAAALLELREWISRYQDYVFWRRTGGKVSLSAWGEEQDEVGIMKRWDELGERLVMMVVELVGERGGSLLSQSQSQVQQQQPQVDGPQRRHLDEEEYGDRKRKPVDMESYFDSAPSSTKHAMRSAPPRDRKPNPFDDDFERTEASSRSRSRMREERDDDDDDGEAVQDWEELADDKDQSGSG
ncbi:hypothetical protein HK102_001713, partial [Quaeritorhiza haematococci]